MTLDAIVLTHKHLDHAGDVNAMIEAMTQGGTQRRGLVLAPEDAYGEDPVILRYVRDYPARTDVLAAGGAHKIGELLLETPLRLRHSVETYGLRLRGPRHSVGLISCTGYFPELEEAFRTDLLILNVVYRSPRDGTHLALPDDAEFFRPSPHPAVRRSRQRLVLRSCRQGPRLLHFCLTTPRRSREQADSVERT